MTRINAGMNPAELTRAHLIAEHREIKRVPNSVRTGQAILVEIPDVFRMGTGHVRFFYDKLGYLKERYIQIRDECYRRGYNVTDYVEAWNGVPDHLMNGWEPTDEAIRLVSQRIAERLR